MLKIDSEYIRVKAIPSSPKTELVSILNDDNGKTLKIRIKAPPEKNKANIELIKFLSKELEIPKENIKILSGRNERIKLLKIIQ